MPRGHKLEWHFAQSFGTEESEQGFCEDDIFTAIAFDHKGDYIALGDKAGRVTVFDNAISGDATSSKRKRTHRPVEYKFYTEFQSHERGFDKLHSIDIEEAINMIKFWRTQSSGVFMLTTNDTSIKMWKLQDVRVPVPTDPAGGNSLVVPRMEDVKTEPVARCKREFNSAHGIYHIDSIDINCDGETFISADALRIHLWNSQITNCTYNICDIKPDNLNDLNEVITSAAFHPEQCNLLTYSTSLGTIRLCDLRQSALVHPNACKVFQLPKGDGFFSEVVESISDAKFTSNGRYIVSRDYLSIVLWDPAMTKKPVAVYPVHDYLREYLTELHQNDCIFDKFEVGSSPDGQHFVTGSYDSNFVIAGLGSKSSESVHATSEPLSKKHRRRFSLASKRKNMRQRVANMDFAKKSLHVAWHPVVNAVAVASLNKVYIYQSI